MNKVILLGRLTKDPEIRYSQAAEPMAVARFTVAVNKRFKREGEPDADFIGCVAFGKQAEFVEKYLKKGMQIALTGRISVRTYDDNAGQRRWVTEVVADELEFAESKNAYESRMAQGGGDPYGGNGFESGGYGGQGQSQNRSYPNKPAPAGKAPAYEPEGFSAITDSIDDDDLPF